MSEEVKQVNDAELEMTFDGLAPLTNRFYVSMLGTLARLTFAEQSPNGGLPHFRAAIAMSTSDLVEMHELLGKLLANAVTVQVTPDGVAIPQGTSDGR